MPECPHKLSDADLVKRCKQRENAAWSELYTRFDSLVRLVIALALWKRPIDWNTVDDIAAEFWAHL